jgi:hypothetical protein
LKFFENVELSSKFFKIPNPFAVPLSVSIRPSRRSYNSGDSIDLECVFEGYPIPGVTWFKDGERTNSNGTFLRLLNSTPDSTGTYTCSVENEYGSASDSTSITVTDRGEDYLLI